MESLIGRSVYSRKEQIFGTVESVLPNGQLQISMPEGRVKRLMVPAAQIADDANTSCVLIWANRLKSSDGADKSQKKGY